MQCYFWLCLFYKHIVNMFADMLIILVELRKISWIILLGIIDVAKNFFFFFFSNQNKNQIKINFQINQKYFFAHSRVDTGEIVISIRHYCASLIAYTYIDWNNIDKKTKLNEYRKKKKTNDKIIQIKWNDKHLVHL